MTGAPSACAILGVVMLISAVDKCVPQSFQYVTKVALDKSRDLPAPYHVTSIYGTFLSSESLWVQLWKTKNGSMSEYSLEWQYLLEPTYGNGSEEVVNLSEEDSVIIEDSSLRLGVLNHGVPGPLAQSFQLGNSLVLSVLDLENSTSLEPNETLEFDGLALPYHIPIYFCNETDCPDRRSEEIPVETSTQESVTPQTAGSSSDVGFNSPTMTILLAWNIVLTILVLVLLIALIVTCCRLERFIRKEKSSYRVTQTHHHVIST